MPAQQHHLTLVVDQYHLVRFANQAAEAPLAHRQGLHAKQRRLSHTNKTIRSNLVRLLDNAVTAGRGSAMNLPGKPGQLLRVMSMPLSASSRLATPWQVPLALVMITEPARQQFLPEFYLRQMFRLSPAEVRLAQALVGGMEATEYARAAGVSANTVRS